MARECGLDIESLWGPARQYDCVSCGSQARAWAYDGTDPEQELAEYREWKWRTRKTLAGAKVCQ